MSCPALLLTPSQESMNRSSRSSDDPAQPPTELTDMQRVAEEGEQRYLRTSNPEALDCAVAAWSQVLQEAPFHRRRSTFDWVVSQRAQRNSLGMKTPRPTRPSVLSLVLNGEDYSKMRTLAR